MLALLGEHGINCCGIDNSLEMVRVCQEQGLRAERAEILAHLSQLGEGSLDGIVSFHVIEHMPATSINRLVRLAWRALRPGGLLILESPNPLSIAVAASNFWRDPTHRRPIHPDALWLGLELAGFERMERTFLRPFAREERLPEIEVAQLKGSSKTLAHQINLLRDRLDETLFGFQDYAIIGYRP